MMVAKTLGSIAEGIGKVRRVVNAQQYGPVADSRQSPPSGLRL